MKSIRRCLAFLLSFALLAGLLPGTALAEGDSQTAHAHPICGANCAHNDSTHGGSTTAWTKLWQDENEKIYAGNKELVSDNGYNLKLPAGSYYLEDDITFRYTITIVGDVHLCLNGHELSLNMLDIENIEMKAALTLCDCRGDGELASTMQVRNGFTLYSGSVLGAFDDYSINLWSGTVELAGGEILSRFQNCYGVYFSGGAEVLILSGTTFGVESGAAKIADILLGKGKSITVPKALPINSVYTVALEAPDWTQEVVLAQGDGITEGSEKNFSYVQRPGTNDRAARIEYREADTTANKPARLVLVPTTYRVTFNANSGTGALPDTIEADLTVGFSIPNTQPTRAGYTFMGWSKDSKYNFNAEGWSQETDGFYRADADPSNIYVPLNADTTLYAVWAKNVLDTGGDGAGDYPILELALENAVDGSTIKVLESYTDPEDAMLYNGAGDLSVALDLNGKTITAGDQVYLLNGENLTITGNGTYTGGLVQTPYGKLAIQNGTFGGLLIQEEGGAEIQSGIFQGTNLADEQNVHAIVQMDDDGGSAKAALEQLLKGKNLTGTNTNIYTADYTEEGTGYGMAYIPGPVAVASQGIHSVTFNTGSGITMAQVQEGDKIAKPADPTKEGWIFLGWYKDAAFTNPWDFDTDTVTSPTTLYAKWEEDIQTYSVTVNGGTGGGSYQEGAAVAITATVPSGKVFTGWTVTAGNVTLADPSSATTTFTMPAQAVTVTANFKSTSGDGGASSAPSYSITAPSGIKGGSVSVHPTRAERGDTVTITVTPDEGWELDKLSVTDRSGDSVRLTDKNGSRYTFTMPGRAVTVEAVFVEIEKEPRPWDNPFTDVQGGAWYFEAVRYVYENGLMTGTSAATFSPDATTSRGQIVTILWRMAGSPQTDYLMDFDDVDPAAYYGEAVRWATSVGVVGGYGNGTFGPNDPISREQFAVMLYNYAVYSGMDAVTLQEDLTGFADSESVSPYAVQSLNWAVGEGIIIGKDNQILDPKGHAARAQAAAMLQRFLED